MTPRAEVSSFTSGIDAALFWGYRSRRSQARPGADSAAAIRPSACRARLRSARSGWWFSLAEAVGMDKGQISRALAELVSRMLVAKAVNPRDNRKGLLA